LRRVRRHRATRGVLAVEHAQRIRAETLAVLVSKAILPLLEVCDQFLTIGRPARLITDAVDLEADVRGAGLPEGREQGSTHRDDLHVGIGLSGADHFDAEGAEFAPPTLLRPA